MSCTLDSIKNTERHILDTLKSLRSRIETVDDRFEAESFRDHGQDFTKAKSDFDTEIGRRESLMTALELRAAVAHIQELNAIVDDVNHICKRARYFLDSLR